MDKENNLYFIPIIAKAFESSEPTAAFRDALEEIIRLGKSPEYKEGYKQFEHFLTAGLEGLSEDPEMFSKLQESILNNLFIALATDTFEGSNEIKNALLKRIQANPEISQKYEKILSEISTYSEEKPLYKFELFKEGEFVEAKQLSEETNELYFRNIEPGLYSIKLSNGRVLWEGNVEAKDVIWEEAFPGRDYSMAADTEEAESKPTRTEEILNGEITLAFYAGLESGRIKLSLKEKHS